MLEKYGIQIRGLSEKQVKDIQNQIVENRSKLSGIRTTSYDLKLGVVQIETYRKDENPEVESTFYNVMGLINNEIRKDGEA
jgi:hypothetical protein